MNSKVANLIAAQLGILIGLTSWLVYSHFPSSDSRYAAEMRENAGDRLAPVAPVLRPRNPRPDTVDYRADREQMQPAEETMAPDDTQYDQEVAAEPYANSVPDNSSMAVNSPAYAQTYQEPEVVSSDYQAPPQVVYNEPIQNVLYAQPIQIVTYSDGRHLRNRCEPTHRIDNGRGQIPQQCPDRRNFPHNDPRVVAGPNVNPPPNPAFQGAKPPPGPVRQAGGPSSHPKRAGFPAASGPAGRSAP